MHITKEFAEKVWSAAIGERATLDGAAKWTISIFVDGKRVKTLQYTVVPTSTGFRFAAPPPVIRAGVGSSLVIKAYDPENTLAAEYEQVLSDEGDIHVRLSPVLAEIMATGDHQ